MSKFHRETRQPKGQLQYCSKSFGQGNYLAYSGQSGLFYMVREKTLLFWFDPFRGVLLGSFHMIALQYLLLLFWNKMTGAKYDGEGDDGDANGEDGDE